MNSAPPLFFNALPFRGRKKNCDPDGDPGLIFSEKGAALLIGNVWMTIIHWEVDKSHQKRDCVKEGES